MEFYKKYRPESFDDVIGQQKAVNVLQSFLQNKNLPHALLISGSSGVGKTTIARILKKELNCGNADFHEINVADNRDIETIRSIAGKMNLSPISGSCRIWLLDEVQSLPKIPQRTLLKMLEDTPNHCYFILATTEPNQLLDAIRNRCTPIVLEDLTRFNLKKLINKIKNIENLDLSSEVIEQIIEASNGSARKALVLLNKIKFVKKEDQENEVFRSDARHQAIEICRILISKKTKDSWKNVTTILKEMSEDPESVRRLILAFASQVMLSRESAKAYLILVAFESNFNDSGKAGLIRACYEVLSSR